MSSSVPTGMRASTQFCMCVYSYTFFPSPQAQILYDTKLSTLSHKVSQEPAVKADSIPGDTHVQGLALQSEISSLVQGAPVQLVFGKWQCATELSTLGGLMHVPVHIGNEGESCPTESVFLCRVITPEFQVQD